MGGSFVDQSIGGRKTVLWSNWVSYYCVCCSATERSTPHYSLHQRYIRRKEQRPYPEAWTRIVLPQSVKDLRISCLLAYVYLCQVNSALGYMSTSSVWTGTDLVLCHKTISEKLPLCHQWRALLHQRPKDTTLQAARLTPAVKCLKMHGVRTCPFTSRLSLWNSLVGCPKRRISDSVPSSDSGTVRLL